MNDESPLAERSDERIMDDALACLGIVKPEWFNWMDDSTRVLHVREQLDELEAQARKTGRCETGCMVVEYDPENRVMRWSVLVAYRYDDAETENLTKGA